MEDGCSTEEDRISQLKDEILVSILSLLTIKDAACTCILSKRWKYVWTHTLCLNFDDPKALEYNHTVNSNRAKRELARSRYVGWVNQVLNSHQGLNLDEFRVCFALGNIFRVDVDKWIEFAFNKRVKSLAIDLELFVVSRGDKIERYAFPEKSYLYIKSPCGISSIKSLKHLSLRHVNVTGEVLEHFLSHSPLLDRLTVGGSKNLLNLKVSGLSLQLKFLEIIRCTCLENVEICAPKLASFIYCGVRKRITIFVKYAPSLVELSVGELLDSVFYPFLPFSSHFAQLKTLTLYLDMDEEKNKFPQFPELISLNSLTLKVDARDEESLLEWTSLIKASPILQRFSLQLLYSKKVKRKIRKASKCYHPCLKVVELVGFVGRSIETELGIYLIENAVALEELIIDSRQPSWFWPPTELTETEAKIMARKHAVELGRKLHAGAKLVII